MIWGLMDSVCEDGVLTDDEEESLPCLSWLSRSSLRSLSRSSFSTTHSSPSKHLTPTSKNVTKHDNLLTFKNVTKQDNLTSKNVTKQDDLSTKSVNLTTNDDNLVSVKHLDVSRLTPISDYSTNDDDDDNKNDVYDDDDDNKNGVYDDDNKDAFFDNDTNDNTGFFDVTPSEDCETEVPLKNENEQTDVADCKPNEDDNQQSHTVESGDNSQKECQIATTTNNEISDATGTGTKNGDTPSSCAGAVGRELRKMALLVEPTRDELVNPSVYHGVAVPDISIDAYLTNLQRFCHFSDECLVLALIYTKRLLRTSTTLRFNMLTVHRIALSCVVIATKFFEDVFYTNNCYARGGGIRVTQELNCLEAETLRQLNFDLYVSQDLYLYYQAGLNNGGELEKV